MLATDSTTNEIQFTQVIRPADVTNWVAAGASRTHTLALADDGRTYAWGYGAYGALGNGSFASYQSQVKSVTYRLSIAPAGSTEISLGADVPSDINWVIEASNDLHTWSGVSTNVVHQARLQSTRSAIAPAEVFRLNRLR
jgi:hypothetical protein